MKTSLRSLSAPSPLRSAAAPRPWLAGLALAAAPWLAAQPDCRSILGAHLKPYSLESQISWAGELVTIPAYMENRYANNSMLFGAIDFTSRSKRHQLYFEGGAKRSTVDAAGGGDTEHTTTKPRPTPTRPTSGPACRPAPARANPPPPRSPRPRERRRPSPPPPPRPALKTIPRYGWREFFYQYRSEATRVRVGLSTTRLGDQFLVNERTLGFSLQQSLGRATLAATAGSVGDFARMTDFCGTKRLTNLVEKEKYETVGHDFGDTNLAGLVLAWDLTRATPAARPAGADEFALSDDLAPRRSATLWGLHQVGLVSYHEFDRIADENRSWFGTFARFELPAGVSFQAEALYQDAHTDAVILHGLAQKDYFWSNASNTSFHAGYFGKVNRGGAAAFEASFSNLFKGEIMRMDAIDIPLVYAGVRHNFPGRRKTYVQLQGVEQLHAENMKEVDLEVGTNVLKHLRVVAIGSYIYSRATKEPENYVAKMEVRLGF
jgi:hypothetical protein